MFSLKRVVDELSRAKHVMCSQLSDLEKLESYMNSLNREMEKIEIIHNNTMKAVIEG